MNAWHSFSSAPFYCWFPLVSFFVAGIVWFYIDVVRIVLLLLLECTQTHEYQMPHSVSSDDNSHSIHVQHLLLGSKSNPNSKNMQPANAVLAKLLLLFWGVFIYISAMQIAWSMKLRGLMAVGKRACVSHFKSHAITKFAWFCLEWLQTIMVITTSNKRCTYTHTHAILYRQVEE